MQTTAVLLALATAAIAAPALHEDLTDERTAINYLDTRDINTRERKSTLESSSSPVPGNPVSLPASQVSEFGVTGRTFNLKKPIIIKKKVGHSYHGYRDSDDEKLDSSEPCRKHVKVQLCDPSAHSEITKSATIEDSSVQMTEDDMKHSIKLAKEAVENLHNNMKKIETKPSTTTHLKHREPESDVELHQDIEVARQALEHIHNNFGTLKDAEVVEDVASPLVQTEEERLAQWKEAIQNIQRNVEIVRNIEDSFKSTHDDISHTEEAATHIKDVTKNEVQKLSTKEDKRVSENLKMEHKPSTEHMEPHSTHEKSSESEMMKVAELPEKDMIVSASMVSASKLQAQNHDEKARLTSDNHLNPENIAKPHDALHKQAEDTITLNHLPQNTDISQKTVEKIRERKTETGLQHLEIADKTEKKMESEMLLEKQRNAMKELHGNINIKETKEKKNEMKSAEPLATKHTEAIKHDDKNMQGLSNMEPFKQAGGFESGIMSAAHMNKDFSSLAETKTHENMLHQDQTLNQGMMALHENAMLPPMSADSSSLDQHRPMMGMKAAEKIKPMPSQMVDAPQMRWSQDKNFNSEMGLMKSAVETHHTLDHMPHTHGHHHNHHHANSHHVEVAHGHPRYHNQFMTDGKSADMDQSTFFMNMRDSDSFGKEGHSFRWKPSHPHTHESPRTAYGAPAPTYAAASGGAVGVFPNANVGGCGIPLLLSCNPSVVSGSLTKPHSPSYSAPAYRTEDDFNFHSKRDVKKTEKLVNTLNRTPMNPNLKTTTVLVAKQ